MRLCTPQNARFNALCRHFLNRPHCASNPEQFAPHLLSASPLLYLRIALSGAKSPPTQEIKMNRKLVLSLFVIANATVVSALVQHHPNRCSQTTAITNEGTQPPAPPPGLSALEVIADGTQPPAPPPGRRTTTLVADRTQAPAPPPGHGTATLMADGTQPPAPPPGRSTAAMRGLSV